MWSDSKIRTPDQGVSHVVLSGKFLRAWRWSCSALLIFLFRKQFYSALEELVVPAHTVPGSLTSMGERDPCLLTYNIQSLTLNIFCSTLRKARARFVVSTGTEVFLFLTASQPPSIFHGNDLAPTL